MIKVWICCLCSVSLETYQMMIAVYKRLS